MKQLRNTHSRPRSRLAAHSAHEFGQERSWPRLRCLWSNSLRPHTSRAMVDSERAPDGDARWWMGCQPHIRALRETMHSTTANREVEKLLQKCVSLYMATIHHNSSLADQKICIALSGGRITAMEASFMWLGGWRPTTALLLVYSLMGVQLEDEIRNFGYGIRDLTNASAVLSHRQLINLTNVQKSTRAGEKKLSKKLADIQMLISDQDVLAAVMQVESSSSPSTSRSSSTIALRTVLKPRMSRVKKLLIQADQLRLHTLHQLFLVLTPVQVARCAIAAFELAFMMHALGNSAQSRHSRTAIPASLEISQPSPSCSSQDYSTSVDQLEPRSDDD